ncbi:MULTISPECIES: HAD family hydrolase [Thalassospira]|uniref:phosphoglycolate phosphatase n=1 Tax=Thalassospira profundimaris TaxID=502049 RepID=A0A367V6V1_9PROT|nr:MULTISPECIES: HAD-IA family hydrolase [Thalassospira]KZB70422.1 phosphoglycolate phosphatase [Thalassospira sp. MCCC 1A01148]MBR9901729.1 HAD-IA family hydrolase [Rhodospirillales bacterium]RCK20936.1 phosphoglycolate phosphatase [Thalassospira profundimaris]
MAKFILFDLDGTLIDGVDDILFAMNDLLAAHGHAPLVRHDIEAMLGDGTWMLTKRAFAARGSEPTDAMLDELNVDFNARYVETDYAYTRLFEHAEPVLRQLKSDGWTIALASNKPEAPCKAILTKLGVADLFSVIAGGDSFEVKKPDGCFLDFVLGQLGFDKSTDTAIMVGDHANDVNAARAAGIHVIAVAMEIDDTRANTLGADAVATAYQDLPAAIRAIIE